jgi:hypothetical protein
MKKLFLILVMASTSLISYAKEKESNTAVSTKDTYDGIYKRKNPDLKVGLLVAKTNYKKSKTLSGSSIGNKKSLVSTVVQKKDVLVVGPAEDNCRQVYNQTVRMLKDAIYSDSNQPNEADEWIIMLIAMEQYQECIREANGSN